MKFCKAVQCVYKQALIKYEGEVFDMLLTEFKAIFKNREYKFFILFYMLITILVLNILYAVGWATFGGFGIGELTYTHTGAIVVISSYLNSYLLVLGVFIAKMISLYRKREGPKTYLLYMLACISGIVLGTIIFWLDLYTVHLIWRAVGINLIHIIKTVGWVNVPMPHYESDLSSFMRLLAGILLLIILLLFAFMIYFVIDGVKTKNREKAIISIIIFLFSVVPIIYFIFITSM